MKTAEFLIEAQLIVTGKHPAYRFGYDRIYAFESYCHTVANDMPEQAVAIAEDIYANIDAAVEVGNMTPHRTEQAAMLLKKYVELAKNRA